MNDEEGHGNSGGEQTLSRRKLLQMSGLGIGSLALANLVAEESSPGEGSEAGPKRKIGYIRENIPHIEMASLAGERYRDRIPDTLDLAERAQLAINALTRATNPKADHEMYFSVRTSHNPPLMDNDFNYWNQFKWMEGLTLLRVASGSDLNLHVDRLWREVVLKCVGPDGLIYLPVNGRPWGWVNFQDVGQNQVFLEYYFTPVWKQDGTTTTVEDKSVTQYAHPFTTGRSTGVLTGYYLQDGNPEWKRIIERMIDRALELTIDKGNYGYYPVGFWEPFAKLDPHAKMPLRLLALDKAAGRTIQGPTQYYRVSHYPPAKELAGKLANYIRFHSEAFDDEGRFAIDGQPPPYQTSAHFHAHTQALQAMLEYAIVAEDQDLLSFCKKSFEWARQQGFPLIGWFPDEVNFSKPSSTCEGCELADLIAIALKLSEAGAGDYWDDIDRWTRNMFAEMQMIDPGFMYLAAEKRGSKRPLKFNETDDHVPERNVGGFSGWAKPNEFSPGMMHCCLGNCSRAIYYIWQDILEYKHDQLTVNLLLNRASPWADLYSSIPYEGKVELRMKRPCRSVQMRVPEWITSQSQDIVAEVNGSPRNLIWSGRYVGMADLKPQDKVRVSFPIKERTVRENICGVDYTLIIKGNTVVDISPQGRAEEGPLFQRADYRKNQTPWREVERFAANEPIRW